MTDLTRVDASHTDLHAKAEALDNAKSVENLAEQERAQAELTAAQAIAAHDQAIAAREEAEAAYNTACDQLSQDSIAAKLDEQSPE